MKEEEILRLRVNLLRQLKAADPLSLPVSALAVGARHEGFEVSAEDKELRAQLEHLADPQIAFARQTEEKFSRSIKRYKLTAEGREWLAEQGY